MCGEVGEMSRIGRKPIEIPQTVKVKIEGDIIEVQGPKGVLVQQIPEELQVQLEDGKILVQRKVETRKAKALHGLTRTLIANMVRGVTEGFEKRLDVVGVGYRAQLEGNALKLSLGYSHPVVYPIPEGIKIEIPQPTKIVVKGIDKHKVGQVAAEIRSFREPDSYKGKGIRYEGEVVRLKAGKGRGKR